MEYDEAIKRCVEYGVFKLDKSGNFRPNSKIKRLQYLTALQKLTKANNELETKNEKDKLIQKLNSKLTIVQDICFRMEKTHLGSFRTGVFKELFDELKKYLK